MLSYTLKPDERFLTEQELLSIETWGKPVQQCGEPVQLTQDCLQDLLAAAISTCTAWTPPSLADVEKLTDSWSNEEKRMLNLWSSRSRGEQKASGDRDTCEPCWKELQRTKWDAAKKLRRWIARRQDAPAHNRELEHKQAISAEKLSILSDTPLEDANLPVRAYNTLKRAGYNTLGDIANTPRDSLQKTRDLGEKSLADIDEVIRRRLGE